MLTTNRAVTTEDGRHISNLYAKAIVCKLCQAIREKFLRHLLSEVTAALKKITYVSCLSSVKTCYNIGTLQGKMLMKKQNVLYPKALKAIKTLGENLRLARRRRKITAGTMAERANMSLMTLRSIERGSPHVSMCNYMAVIACLGFQEDVAAVAANDVLGRDLQDAEL